MSEAFVYEAVRTPFGRFGGALSGVRPDDLAAHAMRALLERVGDLDPAAIDDVFLGDANGAGEDNRDVARMAVLLAGLPTTVTGVTVNRLCGSSLEAAIQAARAIRCGEASLVDRRRRRVDEPRAVGAAEALACLSRGSTRRSTRRRSAGGWSIRGCPRQWTISLGESAEKLAAMYDDLARRAGRVRAAQPPARREGV